MDVEMKAYELYSPRSTLGPYRARDYWKLPDDVPCELIYGRFYVSPSPSPLHQAALYLLWEFLKRAARTSGGAVYGAPLDTVLADHSVVQPDILYISPERRSIVKQRIEGAPDVVVEIVSPRSGSRDRSEKLRLYAESGVREYWIVDPIERTFDFLVNCEGRFQVAGAIDDRYRSEAFPELQIDLAEFWKEVDAA
jgi:Uma2 family endonuclease